MALPTSKEMLTRQALSDPNSAIYKALVKVLQDGEASAERARAASKYVVVPFFLPDLDIVELERQFSIQIRIRGAKPRIVSSVRVQGLIFLLDSALLEFSSSVSGRVLFIDGDIVTISSLGLRNYIVERTHATPRLSVGYFAEQELLHRTVTNTSKEVPVMAHVFCKELLDGGGEHVWTKVREDGPEVARILVNHFKTPIGPHQLAWLASKRHGIVQGAIFFQHSMLTEDEGELECFPGKYYIDRVSDVITLIPKEDATMSISHPYSSWLEIISNNVLFVDGREYLCEKFNSVKGIVYYSIRLVDSEYEVPEVLMSHFFDSSVVGITEVVYPEVKMSSSGVPVGWTRGVARILTSRKDKVLARLATSTSPIVTPAEVFNVLMDYNNVVVSNWDTLTTADRMSVAVESKLCVAFALHVNWQRHRARGTFNVLLETIKKRHAVADASLMSMAYMALTAWWSKPDVGGKVHDGELPVESVIDWCGNDFSVVMKDVDPWLEFRQATGVKVNTPGRLFPWLPCPCESGVPLWVRRLLEKAKKNLVSSPSVPFKASGATAPGIFSGAKYTISKPLVAVTVTTHEVQVQRAETELSAIKQLAMVKLRSEQNAQEEALPYRTHTVYEENNSGGVPNVPVPTVDIQTSIREDFLMCNKGPVEYDPSAIGIRIAETDMKKNNPGMYSVSDSKRLIPKEVWVRDPKVIIGVEGVRIGSQSTLLAAAYKRNFGIPGNRGTLDLDLTPSMCVDRVIDTCFRSDWQEILNKHLDSGLWEPNVPDIENFLANAENSKMQRLIDNFFLEGSIDFKQWSLMAKGKIKASRDVGGTSSIAHAQTILFQEDGGTNAMFSSMLRRFKEVTDEMMRPEIKLNAQMSSVDLEKWYNTLEPVRKSRVKTYSYGCDIKTYDRSQEHVCLRFEAEWFRRMGLSRERLEKFKETHGTKRAVCIMFGILGTIYLSGISGIFSTLYRNGIVNLAVMVMSADLRRDDIVMLDIKGDDMDAEFSRPVHVEHAIQVMAQTFNLSAKMMTTDVRYMCKEFRIRIHGRWYFISDPWNKVQSLCTPIRLTDNDDKIDERFISFFDGLRHYDNDLKVSAVAEAAQIYYGTDRPLYGFARALAMFREGGKHAYLNFFNPARKVS